MATSLQDTSALLREIVFGAEDGMVSTLGAITGIAVGTGDPYTILLAGLVVIAVESVSMGIGSYISNRAAQEVQIKAVKDEQRAQRLEPDSERRELYQMFVRDGWSRRLAAQMTRSASLNRRLMLKEHEYRELGIFPYDTIRPESNAAFMFIAYLVGGFIPLGSYFFLPVAAALITSVFLTLLGLFALGVFTTRFTNVSPVKAGFRLASMGSLAYLVGLVIGRLATLIK
jgi:vacuolar iron transporter family protein